MRAEMLFYLLLVQLFFGAVLSVGESKCNTCNTTSESCKKTDSVCEDFELCINSTNLDVQEGDDITLMCYSNFCNMSLNITWLVDDKNYEDQNQNIDQNKLDLNNVLSDKNGAYSCRVESACCSCKSEALTVVVNGNSMIIIIICGVAALALVIIMGVVMKIKLKRDNAQHRERMKQRVQAVQNAGQTPSPQRGY